MSCDAFAKQISQICSELDSGSHITVTLEISRTVGGSFLIQLP